jgi:hypothetical protein
VTYAFSNSEKNRFHKALAAAIAIPFIDDIEDYVVESIWAYAKDIHNADPFFNIRSKNLFDVTDKQNGIGWSVKSLQRAFYPGCEFELVIQRAAVYKKAAKLGFPGLSSNSNPKEIGAALLEHWKRKVEGDAATQGVTDKRILVLLKTADKTRYSILEENLHLYTPDEIRWQWTNSAKNGLQGIREEDGMCVYRWYPSQTQFFERFVLGHEAYHFTLEPQRLEIGSVVDMLAQRLQ